MADNTLNTLLRLQKVSRDLWGNLINITLEIGLKSDVKIVKNELWVIPFYHAFNNSLFNQGWYWNYNYKTIPKYDNNYILHSTKTIGFMCTEIFIFHHKNVAIITFQDIMY